MIILILSVTDWQSISAASLLYKKVILESSSDGIAFYGKFIIFKRPSIELIFIVSKNDGFVELARVNSPSKINSLKYIFPTWLSIVKLAIISEDILKRSNLSSIDLTYNNTDEM